MLNGIGEFAAAIVLGLGALVVVCAMVEVLARALPW